MTIERANESQSGHHEGAPQATGLPETVGQLIDRAADLFGSRTAINFFEDGRSLSFAELRQEVSVLSSSLNGLGVSKGTNVAIVLSNRIEFPLCWLSLAKIGAVAVPINPESTEREVAYILENADVHFIILERSVLVRIDWAAQMPSFPPYNRLIVVDHEAGDPGIPFGATAMGTAQQVDALGPVARDDPMSIQYTSGTTGLPKGVIQSHRFWIVCGAAANLLTGNQVRAILADQPIHYIDPQWMLMMALSGGARVDFAKRMTVALFLRRVQTLGTDFAWFPDPILKTPASDSERNIAFKLFIAYGCSRDMVLAAEERFRAPVRELYAMTEIGLGLMVPLTAVDDCAFGTCGVPVPFRECKVVTEDGLDAPSGTAGELWVRGDGICSGYHKCPEANRRLFVDGWFRTGDLFIRDENGNFRIVGRIKDMIRRNCENISAFEVESALMEMLEIADVAAIAVPDPRRDEEVKIFVLLREHSTPTQVPPEKILAHCAKQLSRFKHPRYIEYVSAFPYTSSGKIAKHLLPRDDGAVRGNVFDSEVGAWLE